MKKPSNVNWEAVRARASTFPDEAFRFVRDGLNHTVTLINKQTGEAGRPAPSSETIISAPGMAIPALVHGERKHVTGQQLCLGLRDLALERYGLMAKTVLGHWGVRKTDDFGAIVYSLIDRGELRSSDEDDISHFSGVFDFDEAFGNVQMV